MNTPLWLHGISLSPLRVLSGNAPNHLIKGEIKWSPGKHFKLTCLAYFKVQACVNLQLEATFSAYLGFHLLDKVDYALPGVMEDS